MTTGTGRSPLERAVDLLVYAPLGLLCTARDELPRLIDRGRGDPQVGAARMVGRLAVREGQKEAGKLARRAFGCLTGLGLVPDPVRDDAGSAAPGAARSGAEEPADEPGAPSGGGPAAPDGAGLAIPGYDSLSASQVVQRLDGLSADELEAVRVYEAATRGRSTILSRVSQLQSAP